MRGTAGTMLVLTALSGCAVVNEDGLANRLPVNTRTPGPIAQTEWKRFNLAAAQAESAPAAKTTPAAPTSGTLKPQTPWPTVGGTNAVTAQSSSPSPANPVSPVVAQGTLVSATYVETAREPTAEKAKAATPRPSPDAKTAALAAAAAGTAPVAAADGMRTAGAVTPPPAPPPLSPVVQTASVLPPPEPPVFPMLPEANAAAPEIKPVSHVASQPVTAPSVRMVNSKRIHLNFELKDVGESGVSGIELWYTQDTRSWKKYEGPAQTKAPYIVEVDGEGLYGFTMVARSGVGYSRDIPQAGELPQVWVEVDLTKPAVQITGIELNCTPKAQLLSIRWTASDKNLTARPITLSYAELAEGPWTPIAANLENSGRYEWNVPASVPKRIHVRVEATDLVGHMSAALSATSTLIDRARPNVSILTVEPDKGGK